MSPTYLRISQLASTKAKPGLLPVSPETVWRWSRNGLFPKPIRLSNKVTVWSAEEVRAWQDQRKADAQ